MTGWTPGPWHVHGGNITTVNFDFIACVDAGNRDANARLIAASPDLYEALDNLLAALAMGPLEVAATYGPDAHPDEPVVDAAHRAKAAMAKAKPLDTAT